MSPVLPCVACGSVLPPGRRGGPNDGDRIAYCPSCGLGTLAEPPHPDELARLYATDLYTAGTPRAWPVIKLLHRAINRRLLQRLGPPAGRLLDVGAGRGHLLAAAIEAGWDADGVEFSATSAAMAADLYGVDVVVADFTTLPPTRPYDVLSMIHVLEHLPDPAAALDRARSFLGPEGRILISVPNAASLQARLFGPHWLHLDLPRHLFHFTPRSLACLLEGAGFVVTHVDTSSPDMELSGFIQSTLNAAGFERNVAVRYLKHDVAAGGARGAFAPLALAVAALPGALAWTVLTPRLGHGASLQVVARVRAPS